MVIRVFSIFLALLGAGLGTGFGQEKNKPNVSFGKIQDLEIELVTVPDSVGSGGKSAPTGGDPKSSSEGRWLRIDVPFATEKKNTPEIKFKFYLEAYELVEATEKGGKEDEVFVVLSGEVTYRDVPAGAKKFAGIFLPPSSVIRFAGKRPNGEIEWSSRRMNLRVEALEQGTPVEESFDLHGDKDKGPSGRGGKTNQEWYTGAPPPGAKIESGKMMDGVLIPITETPFWPKDYRRYPQLKKN